MIFNKDDEKDEFRTALFRQLIIAIAVIAISVLGAVAVVHFLDGASSDGDYTQVDYDWTFSYKRTDIMCVYIISFDAEEDGYMSLCIYRGPMISTDRIYTDICYHKGQNDIAIDATMVDGNIYDILFYERR